MRKLVWMALPLGVATLSVSLNSNIPRYFIQAHSGEYGLGIFAAISYLFVAGTTVTAALGQSSMPRLAQYLSVDDVAAFYKLMTRLIGLGIMIGGAVVLVVLVAGREVLQLLYTPEYAEYQPVLVWAAVAAGIGYVGSFLGYGITATRAYKRFTIPYITITIVLVGTSALLVPRYGLLGSAWTLGITSLLQCAMPLVIWRSMRRQVEQTARTLDRAEQ